MTGTGDALARLASEAALGVEATQKAAEANGYSAAGVKRQQESLAVMADIAADQLEVEGH